MANNFPNQFNDNVGVVSPAINLEEADYSAGDYTFTATPRYLKCSAFGILKVDAFGIGTSIDLPVVPGTNWERVTKIYQSGSTAMTVVGCR